MITNRGELTEAEIRKIRYQKVIDKRTPEQKAQHRRAHLKRRYHETHAHRIDESIAQTTLKLELLYEIKAEL